MHLTALLLRHIMLAVGVASAIPVFAQPATNNGAGVPPAKLKEYEDSLARRTKCIGQLPPGSVSVLDQPYVDNPQQGASSPDSSQTLDLYVPPGAGPFPLVIYIHGGAWKGGSKNGEGADMARRWLPEGLAVASLDYRFGKDAVFPGMFGDCIDAVAYLRANADKYHLDARRIGVMGQSAGGHLAGVVAMAEGSNVYAHSGPALQAAVCRCGFFDLTKETSQGPSGWFPYNPRDDFAGLYPGRNYDPALAQKFSPVYLIHPGIPPVLIEHGDKDTTAPLLQSQMFLAALQKAGANATLTNYPDYTHNLWKPDVFAAELTFFRKNFAAVK
jgi:acetyl esterase/lipase